MNAIGSADETFACRASNVKRPVLAVLVLSFRRIQPSKPSANREPDAPPRVIVTTWVFAVAPPGGGDATDADASSVTTA